MKRGKKLLILLAVLLILGACVLLAAHLNVEEEAGETLGEQIYTLSADKVTSLTWEYEGETMTFRKEADGWVYEEDAAFPVDDVPLDKMVTSLTDLRAETVVEAPEALSAYGLDLPTVKVKVTAGEEQTILLGDQTAYGGCCYLSLEDGNVYLVSDDLLTAFSKELYDMVEEETLPDLTGTELESVGLTLTTCVDHNADDAELEAYGLKEPLTISVTCADGTELTIEFASPDEESRYLRISGSPMVYRPSATLYNSLVALTEAE